MPTESIKHKSAARKARRIGQPPHTHGVPARARDQAASLDLSGLTRWVGFMVRIVQVRVFQEYYESLIGQEVTPGVLSVLLAVRDNPGVRHGVLADALVVRRPNMTKLVDSLTRSGLMERRASSDDGRSIVLFVTAKGQRLLDRVEAMSLAHDEATTRALTKTERSELLRLLQKLADGLVDHPAWGYEN